ncbi:MAG: NTP transferase domain-containing protein [Anaerolineales bacterium]|uniref:NTP transferase domain-containing protein n=1 Tax=Candidatus Desulfolinea nitratireducens TaxID=2841698 RepID=A0A8J6NM30_9CHLR|nr:NTP transferase domain-containing protein [Candidatus Desulfolinea nitratireducens]
MILYPVVILAGGLAVRLRPITEEIPKALVEVGGEPFIVHQLRLLYSRGIRNVIISAWYLGEMIREFIGDGSRFGMQVQYVFDGEKALGTAGAVRKALGFIDGPFFVLNGDTYFPCDFAAIQTYFELCAQSGLMTVNYNQMDWHDSNVEFKDGEIIRHDKQNRDALMQHVDAGLALFDPIAFAHLPEGQSADLMDVFQKLLAEGKLLGYEEQQRFYEVGSFSGLKELDMLLSENPDRFLAG